MPNRKRNFVLLTALSTSVFVAIACGGDKPEAKNPANGGGADTTASSAAPSSTDKSGSSGSGTTGGGGDTPTTTTSNLPDSGELQGAKLGSHTHSEVETKGDAGPKRPEGGGSANEPGRGAKDIQAIVASHRDEARACYDKALAAHPGIEGDLDIRWKIDPTGAVTDAEVDTTKSQILEPSVGQCIIDIIKKIKFAASAKGFESRAHYPFNFHPKPGQKK